MSPSSTVGCGSSSCACADLAQPQVASINGIALHEPDEVLDAQTLRERAYTELLIQEAVKQGLLPLYRGLVALQPDEAQRLVIETMLDQALFQRVDTLYKQRAELGLTHKDIHDARFIRDAEAAEPGLVRRTLDERLERGEEPTRAALRRAAEARLERSIDRLRRTQESVQRLEAEKASPLSPEERARQVAVFGTLEDRAICARIDEIVELIGEQPDAAEAVRRIPPASRHAIDTVPIRRAAAWLTGFSTLFEQEAHHGNHASE